MESLSKRQYPFKGLGRYINMRPSQPHSKNYSLRKKTIVVDTSGTGQAFIKYVLKLPMVLVYPIPSGWDTGGRLTMSKIQLGGGWVKLDSILLVYCPTILSIFIYVGLLLQHVHYLLPPSISMSSLEVMCPFNVDVNQISSQGITVKAT